MGIFGFCGDRAVGVDIEQIRPIDNMEAIAGRFFAEPESAALCRAEIPLKRALFFRLWTMKEAWIKAAGEGLYGLRQINRITIPGDGHGRNDWQCVADRSGLSWMLRTFRITAGYASAVAVSDIEHSSGLGYHHKQRIMLDRKSNEIQRYFSGN
jgi:4'-phosphopantetheinyl transferase